MLSRTGVQIVPDFEINNDLRFSRQREKKNRKKQITVDWKKVCVVISCLKKSSRKGSPFFKYPIISFFLGEEEGELKDELTFNSFPWTLRRKR